MKKLKFIIFLLLPLSIFAQGLTNNGGFITIQSGAYVSISGGANGNYINQTNAGNTGKIDLNGTIDIQGNWVNNAAAGNYIFTGSVNNDGTVIFNSSIAQTIGGNETTYFENVVLNNSNGLTLNFSSFNNKDVRVNGNLNLTLGNIITQTNLLALSTTSHVFGGSLSSYVYGNIKKEYSNSAQTDNPFTFPLGTIGGMNPGFSPATINFTTSKPISGSLTMNANSNKDTHADPVLSLNRYWTLTNNSLVFSGNYDATFTYLAEDFVTPFTEATYEPIMLWGNWVSNWTYPVIYQRNSLGSGGSISVTGLNTFGENTGLLNVPNIVNQPAGGVRCTGQGFTFNVTASNSTGLTYQWYKAPSQQISGATSSSYTISNLVTGDSGDYYCIVSNEYSSPPMNSVTSNTATLNVDITPIDYSVTGGGSYCIGGAGNPVGVSNSQSGVLYQLKLNGANMDSPVNGTGTSISFGNQTSQGIYTVVANDGTCITNMNGSVNININSLPNVYTVIGGGSYCTGGSGVEVGLQNSESGINYKLLLNGIFTGKVVSGAGSSITFGNQINAGTYTVVAVNVSTTCESTMSSSATVVLNNAVTISNNPETISVCSGNPANFSMSAAGTGILSYQWQRNNINISGATNANYNISSAQISTDAGIYNCVVTNICGAVTSSSAILTVNTMPVIIARTPDAIKCTRDSVLFKVIVNSVPLTSYYWTKDGTNISGATKSTYQISVILPSDAGIYKCSISNTCGTASASILLAVNNSPFIEDTIPNQTVCEGSSISFSFHATGSNLKYQWANIGGSIPGATTSAYSINEIKVSDGNVYTCSVSNSCDSKVLNSFVLSVKQKPSISIVPLIQTKSQGDSLTYTLTPTGSEPFSYQWLKNNTILDGVTMNPYKIKPISCNDAGLYAVVISNMCGSTSSLAGTLLVNCGGYTLSGYVTYDDKANKPMTNTTVFLQNSNSEIIASAQTDASGFYQFLNVTADVYKIQCETTYKWGGSNPTDALLINKYFVMLYSFADELKKQAADVNLDGKINSTDALIINKRFVSLITKFTAPDWIFETPTVIVSSGDIQQNIKAICTGDVDGSY